MPRDPGDIPSYPRLVVNESRTNPCLLSQLIHPPNWGSNEVTSPPIDGNNDREGRPRFPTIPKPPVYSSSETIRPDMTGTIHLSPGNNRIGV